MKTYISNGKLILELNATDLDNVMYFHGYSVIDQKSMLKYFRDNLLKIEDGGGDFKINELLDALALNAIESGEKWCEEA